MVSAPCPVHLQADDGPVHPPGGLPAGDALRHGRRGAGLKKSPLPFHFVFEVEWQRHKKRQKKARCPSLSFLATPKTAKIRKNGLLPGLSLEKARTAKSGMLSRSASSSWPRAQSSRTAPPAHVGPQPRLLPVRSPHIGHVHPGQALHERPVFSSPVAGFSMTHTRGSKCAIISRAARRPRSRRGRVVSARLYSVQIGLAHRVEVPRPPPQSIGPGPDFFSTGKKRSRTSHSLDVQTNAKGGKFMPIENSHQGALVCKVQLPGRRG